MINPQPQILNQNNNYSIIFARKTTGNREKLTSIKQKNKGKERRTVGSESPAERWDSKERLQLALLEIGDGLARGRNPRMGLQR
jgi:hypothetical protein